MDLSLLSTDNYSLAFRALSSPRKSRSDQPSGQGDLVWCWESHFSWLPSSDNILQYPPSTWQIQAHHLQFDEQDFWSLICGNSPYSYKAKEVQVYHWASSDLSLDYDICSTDGWSFGVFSHIFQLENWAGNVVVFNSFIFKLNLN